MVASANLYPNSDDKIVDLCKYIQLQKYPSNPAHFGDFLHYNYSIFAAGAYRSNGPG